jgi:uncharacterized protein (DUF1778 family)
LQDFLLNKNMGLGRPKLQKSEKKAHITGVRLRPTERSLLEKAASHQNKSLSDWIRDTLLSKAGRELR